MKWRPHGSRANTGRDSAQAAQEPPTPRHGPGTRLRRIPRNSEMESCLIESVSQVPLCTVRIPGKSKPATTTMDRYLGGSRFVRNEDLVAPWASRQANGSSTAELLWPALGILCKELPRLDLLLV